MDRIAQRTPKALEGDLDHIAIFQPDAGAKTQAVRSEEMDVQISGAPVSFKFKVMMFQILQAVAHFGFAGTERA